MSHTAATYQARRHWVAGGLVPYPHFLSTSDVGKTNFLNITMLLAFMLPIFYLVAPCLNAYIHLYLMDQARVRQQ